MFMTSHPSDALIYISCYKLCLSCFMTAYIVHQKTLCIILTGLNSKTLHWLTLQWFLYNISFYSLNDYITVYLSHCPNTLWYTGMHAHKGIVLWWSLKSPVESNGCLFNSHWLLEVSGWMQNCFVLCNTDNHTSHSSVL